MTSRYPQEGTIHHTTVIVTDGIQYGPKSQCVTCPHCNRSVHTKIKYESTSGTHLWALICCCICWPCFCLPYCCGSCMNTNHYCPKCKAFLGTYHS